ncbi:MAG: ATP phosphoribosyltransferase [Spartobacteria bacterium]|nr:ATP phosphoribosyltransferase [Spartobacteria bacterium]
MLKIALPNKGSLSEGAIHLMSEAGYSCRRHSRELFVYDKDHDVEFVFLRPRDIAVYVGRGILDLGITGRDLAFEAQVATTELLALGFGRSRFCYAVPRDSGLNPDKLAHLRVATSYPCLVKHDMKQRGIECDIVELDGAVEISIKLGVADAIADVVQSGRTLVEAGLHIVGEPIFQSEAIVISREQELSCHPDVKMCLERLQGIVTARDYVVIEYDAPKSVLEQVCAITPGIESPTIAPLSRNDWMAVKAMVKRKEINRIMDDLSAQGAKGIIVTDIRTCRL